MEKEEENVMKSNDLKRFQPNILWLALVVLTFFLLLPAVVSAQTDSQNRDYASDDNGETIVVHVWAESTPPGETNGPALSRDFVAAGLRTMTGLREWQRHLERTIRNGYPLEEESIGFLRERAADRLVLASLAAATNVDRAALYELSNQYDNLRQWSDGLVAANRNLELAQLYMSPSALENDELFQKAVGCANFLAPMLASGHLRQDAACH